MEQILIDTNILIAFLDIEHVNHELVHAELRLHSSRILMATTSFIECLVKAYEKGYEFAFNYELTFWKLVHSTVDLTQNIARKSAQLLAHENIGFADSIVWATAETQGLVLWTLDRRLANKSPNIRYLLDAN